MIFKKKHPPLPYIRIEWSNGDTEEICVTEEYLKSWEKSFEFNSASENWAMTSTCGNVMWRFRHARKIMLVKG